MHNILTSCESLDKRTVCRILKHYFESVTRKQDSFDFFTVADFNKTYCQVTNYSVSNENKSKYGLFLFYIPSRSHLNVKIFQFSYQSFRLSWQF